MFSFGRKNKMVEATPHMRRIVDLTTPSLLFANENRQSRRYSRALTACICGWSKGKADYNSISLAITKDISDTGIGVITKNRIVADDVMLTFLVETESTQGLAFFRAAVQRTKSCGGFWEHGLLVSEFLNDNYPKETNVVEGLILNSIQDHIENCQASTDAGTHPSRGDWF